MFDSTGASGDQLLAILEGGPQSLDNADRQRTEQAGTTRIKVAHLGGYEQFERTEERRDGGHTVFRWFMRTHVAE